MNRTSKGEKEAQISNKNTKSIATLNNCEYPLRIVIKYFTRTFWIEFVRKTQI